MNSLISYSLKREWVCNIMLPHISKRNNLEETEGLPPRISALMEAMEGVDRRAEKVGSRSQSCSQHTGHSGSRSVSQGSSRDGSRSRMPLSDVDGEGQYVSRSPSRSGLSYFSQSRSISPDWMDLGDKSPEAGLFPGIGGDINVDTEAIPGDVWSDPDSCLLCLPDCIR